MNRYFDLDGKQVDLKLTEIRVEVCDVVESPDFVPVSLLSWMRIQGRVDEKNRNDDDEIEGKKRRIQVSTGREMGWKRARYKENKNLEFSSTIAYGGEKCLHRSLRP
ncbi:hypothetical protein R6Q59_011333 [Mikania micrantha]